MPPWGFGEAAAAWPGPSPLLGGSPGKASFSKADSSGGPNKALAGRASGFPLLSPLGREKAGMGGGRGKTPTVPESLSSPSPPQGLQAHRHFLPSLSWKRATRPEGQEERPPQGPSGDPCPILLL
ncbi:hypothetical protein E2320_022236 [Naja naja]|nr:hypothetical protein E2320_022236 [Naja naja]